MSDLEELQKQLRTLTGTAATLSLFELWERFLRSNGYTYGTLLERMWRYSRDVNIPLHKMITGRILPVDTEPAQLPGAPTITNVARAGSGQIAVSYTPAAANGAEITAYTITSSPGGFTATGLTNPLVVSGLANGTSYTFTGTATNSVGVGPASGASSAITPATVPDAPTIGTATRTSAGVVSVPFTANGTGGTAITGYTVLVSPGGAQFEGGASPISVTGLTPTQAYTFQARANNAVGASSYSASSNSVTPYTVPDAPVIGTATLVGDTSASVSFTHNGNTGGSPITQFKITATPGGATQNGSTSPITISGLTGEVTYTFTALATNAAGDSAQSAASNPVTAISPPIPPTGPFDALYSPSWVPVEGTTALTPPVQSIPSKSIGVNSPSYTDGNYGTKIFRVANTNDSPNNGTTKMRHEYSRRQPFNCDSTKFMLQNASGFFFVYDAETFECLDGGITTNDAKLRAVGTNSIYPKDPRDWTWHPTDPNKIIYLPAQEGFIAYEYDVVTHVQTTKFNLTSRMSGAGFPTATQLRSFEGRCSDDARYWGWQVLNGSTVLGYMTYDMQTDTITGTLVTSNGANNVTMSPSGTYIVISASGAGLTYDQCAASSSIRGTRAYTRDFSSFKQVHITTNHCDVGYDYLGNEVFLGLNPGSSSGLWTAIDPNCMFYITMNNADGPVQLIDLAPAMSQWNSHYSGTCAPGRPGWSVFSAYDSTNRAGFPRYLDNNVALVELKPAGKVYRIANHRTTRFTYWQEPHATMSRDGLRIMYACAWDNTSSANAALSYMIGLPSWVYGTVAPPTELLNFTFDSSAGWALGSGGSITGGKLHCNNVGVNVTHIYATTVLPAGTYDIQYTISEWTGGNVTMRINTGAGGIISGTTRIIGTHSEGTYTDRVTTTATSTEFQVRCTTPTTANVKLDDIKVKTV